MTKTPETFSNPEIPTITPDTGTDRPKTYRKITYLEKNNIDEVICQKLSKKDVYETDMHNIYNIILGQTTYQLQDKAASYATFQEVKSGQDLIGYLMILKKLLFSNQYEHHPIRFLFLSTR